MNKKKKLIPALRFPKFVKDGEWEKNVLGSVATFSKGKGISKSDITPDGTQPCIRYGELYTHYNEIIDSIISKTNLPKEQLVFSQKNDVIIPSSGETQEDIATASCVLKDDVALGGDINIIRTNINGVFLSYYFNNAKKREIAKIAQGNAVVHLYISQLEKLEIEIPDPLEQQKIASCLSSIDELIVAHNDKLETLKDYKKGLMQNLFPQEGQKVPNYRFSKFAKDGEWIEKILQEVAEYQNGKAHEKDIHNNGDFIVVNSKFISTEGGTAKKSNSAFCLAEKGDILMVLSDLPNGKALAKCFYINEENKYTVNQRICKITSFDCENLFLYYIMNRNPYFLTFDDGVKQTNLRNDDVIYFPFLMPSNPKEQKKVSNFLNSLDDTITEQTKKIEQLQFHKIGLMQGLFPKIES